MIRYALMIVCACWGLVNAQQPPKENELDPSIDVTDFNNELDLFTITRTAIKTHAAGLEYIYNKYKGEDKKFFGEIMVKITLNKEGTVTGCKVMKSQLNNRAFQNEIIKAIKTWKFGELPDATQNIIVPFYFK